MELIDIGVNLTGSSFNKDLVDVVGRAKQAGVINMLITASSVSDSAAVVSLIEQYPGYMYGTAGIHPHHADEYDSSSAERLRECLQYENVRCVGECGLDFNRNYSISTNQVKAFEMQLELALDTGMPAYLHQRDAHADFLAMIRNCGDRLEGVAHCFTGTPQQAIDYLDAGLYIGVTGWICDERRGHDLQQAVKEIPLDRIMLETDAPYLLPRDLPEKPVHARRNEPCFMSHICSTTANYMDVDADDLAQASVTNTRRFLGLTPSG